MPKPMQPLLPPQKQPYQVGDRVHHRYLQFGSGGLVNDSTSYGHIDVVFTSDEVLVNFENGHKKRCNVVDIERVIPAPPRPPDDPPEYVSVYGNDDAFRVYYPSAPLWKKWAAFWITADALGVLYTVYRIITR